MLQLRPLRKKISRQGNKAVGEFVNHIVNDSAAFGLPLLYNKQLPDLYSQG